MTDHRLYDGEQQIVRSIVLTTEDVLTLIRVGVRSLQCTRTAIHKQLILSFLLRCILICILFEPFMTGRRTSYRNHVRIFSNLEVYYS